MITRPNGKAYRPRKVVVHPWDNTERDPFHGQCGVYVFGTHDIAASQAMADEAVKYYHDNSMVAGDPQLVWVRDAMENGERVWIHDAVRGRAAVMWVAEYDDRVPGETIRTTDKEN